MAGGSLSAADRVLVLGRLGAAYGIKGYLRVRSYAEQPRDLFAYAPWLLGRGGPPWQPAAVSRWQPHGRGFIVLLDGCHDREAAAAHAGCDIGIPRASLPPPAADEFYLCDLEGCRVTGLHDADLGTVTGLIDQGPGTLLVVTASDGRQRLIPFVRGPIVRSLDLAGRLIEVEWAEDY